MIAGAPDSEWRDSRQQPQQRASGERRRLRWCAVVCSGGARETRCSPRRPCLSPALCAVAVRTWCSARRRSAAARRRPLSGGRPQSGRNRIGRPFNRIKSFNNHSHKYKKVKRKGIMKTNMVGGALSPHGGREASFLTAARSAKKISRCKNSTGESNYPRAIRRARSKTKSKIGKTAISRRSFSIFEGLPAVPSQIGQQLQNQHVRRRANPRSLHFAYGGH